MVVRVYDRFDNMGSGKIIVKKSFHAPGNPRKSRGRRGNHLDAPALPHYSLVIPRRAQARTRRIGCSSA